MKKFSLFVFGILLICLCGCSDPVKEKEKSNAALRAEVAEILETLQIVDKKMLTSVDRGDIVNNDILQTVEKLKRLRILTNYIVHAKLNSQVDEEHFPYQQFKKLTERYPGVVPFYIEDEISGNIYFAPPPEQEFIINKYREWFDRNGGTFDFDASLKSISQKQ